MTVTYTAEVASCRGLGCFLKLLLRWEITNHSFFMTNHFSCETKFRKCQGRLKRNFANALSRKASRECLMQLIYFSRHLRNEIMTNLRIFHASEIPTWIKNCLELFFSKIRFFFSFKFKNILITCMKLKKRWTCTFFSFKQLQSFQKTCHFDFLVIPRSMAFTLIILVKRNTNRFTFISYLYLGTACHWLISQFCLFFLNLSTFFHRFSKLCQRVVR